mmetsp:Transcript_25052/g.63510  ORF Transcript_25052/g.63510 Transcript_25052/m.63510 type:complete len:209 (+) Transcript_25052:682-1308(+)
MVHQHLPAGRAARPDANGGDGQRGGDCGGDGPGHALEHDGEAARCLQRQRLLEHAQRLVSHLRLRPETANDGDGLRSEAHVTHDRHPCLHDGARSLHARGAAALQFDGVHAALLEQPHRAPHRVAHARLVRAKGQVAHQERAPRAPRHRPAVHQHVVERDGQRGVVAVHHHGRAIAHQQDVDARAVDVHRRRVVVRGDHGDGLLLGVL